MILYTLFSGNGERDPTAGKRGRKNNAVPLLDMDHLLSVEYVSWDRIAVTIVVLRF